MLDRYNTNFENLTNAVERLHEGVQAYQENPAKIIRDGVIQRFEFTCELAWKTTREFLLDQGFTELNSPKATMRKAFSYGLIDDEQAWIVLLNARNQTSHLYDDATAQEIYSQIESEFVSLFDKLIEQLKRGEFENCLLCRIYNRLRLPKFLITLPCPAAWKDWRNKDHWIDTKIRYA